MTALRARRGIILANLKQRFEKARFRTAASGSGRDNGNKERATRRAPKPAKPLHHNALGCVHGHAVRLALSVGDALLVGEGIETALSLVAAVPALPAAALSAGSLAAFAPAAGRLAPIPVLSHEAGPYRARRRP